MKSSDVHIGHTYSAKVSGAIVPVRITGTSTHGGWVAQNTKTGRAVRIKSPQRLRAEVPGATGPPSGRAAPPSALSQFRELKSRDPEVILFFAADTAFRPNYHVFNDDIQSLDAISPAFRSWDCGRVTGDSGASVATVRHERLEHVLARVVAAGRRAAVCERVKADAAGRARPPKGAAVERVVTSGD
jgi:hypothetical protein